MDGTMRILEQRFALFILLRVYHNPGISKKEAVDEEGGSHMPKYNTLDKLIDKGLIRVDEATLKYNIKKLYLTDLGMEVATRLDEIHDILPYEECLAKEYKRAIPPVNRLSISDRWYRRGCTRAACRSPSNRPQWILRA